MARGGRTRGGPGGPRWKVAAARERERGGRQKEREQSNSNRKFLYGVQCAAHSQLEARNRLVFANRARPTSRRASRARAIPRRARCPNSPLRYRDLRFGISTFTASSDTQSSAGAAGRGRRALAVRFDPRVSFVVLRLYCRLRRYYLSPNFWALS